MPDEMTPQLSKNEYQTEIEVLAERMLRRLADDKTGELAYEESDIRPLLSETETFHEEYPLSALEYSQHSPNPGAWSWINDAVPRKGLCRQALDMVAQDVARLVEVYAGTEAYTYWQGESIHVRVSFDSESGTAVETGGSDSANGDGRTQLTARTAVSDAPAVGTSEHEQMVRTVESAINGALYESGYVGHVTTVTTEDDK